MNQSQLIFNQPIKLTADNETGLKSLIVKDIK